MTSVQQNKHMLCWLHVAIAGSVLVMLIVAPFHSHPTSMHLKFVHMLVPSFVQVERSE